MGDGPGDATLTDLFRGWAFWACAARCGYPGARRRATLAWELYVGELLSCSTT